MSLVNDALKRARQAQSENPPPTPPLHFQPADPAQENAARSPLLFVGLALLLILGVGLGGLAIWFAVQKQADLKAAARVAATSAPEVADAPPKPTTTQESVVAPTNPPVALKPPLLDLGQRDTNTAIVAAPVEPPPPLLKLQGIFFNPRSPSAVVSGRTVYVGDRVNGFQVQAITPRAVTLVNATGTNVLSLSP
jgi:hypothetical protein